MRSSILSFKLNVATVEKNICVVDVIKLTAVGVNGEFQILKNHAPFLTRLIPGYVYYVDANTNSYDGFVLSGGIVEVQPGQVFIFADTAVRSVEIDYEKSRKEEADMLHKLSLIRKGVTNKEDYDSMKIDLLVASAKLVLLKQIKKLH